MKTILLAVDFSPATKQVVSEAVKLAQATKARVVVLNVVQPPVVVSDYAPLMENIVDFISVSEKAAAKRLKKLKSEISLESVAVETQMTTGSPLVAIVAAAESLPADYIVMGSHGHTALYDLVAGSTTHGVLKRARCPVLIVPSQCGVSPKRAAAR
ncbi:MAG: universal stress protein [Opitutaceae bacterium]